MRVCVFLQDKERNEAGEVSKDQKVLGKVLMKHPKEFGQQSTSGRKKCYLYIEKPL